MSHYELWWWLYLPSLVYVTSSTHKCHLFSIRTIVASKILCRFDWENFSNVLQACSNYSWKSIREFSKKIFPSVEHYEVPTTAVAPVASVQWEWKFAHSSVHERATAAVPRRAHLTSAGTSRKSHLNICIFKRSQYAYISSASLPAWYF